MRYELYKTVARFHPPSAFFCEFLFYAAQTLFQRPRAALVSYPKSGRTWLHFMLIRYYAAKLDIEEKSRLIQMSRKDNQIPSMVITHDGKSDRWWNRSKSAYQQTDILFMARDPRDTLVSHYHHTADRDRIFGKPISDFVYDPHYGIRQIIEFMNAWARSRNIPRNFLLCRYEDLKSDPMSGFSKVLNFLGEDQIDSRAFETALRDGDFSNMQKQEKAGPFKVSGLSQKVEDANALKVRKGKIGGYRDELTPEDLAYVDELVQQKLDPFFGYD